MVVGVVSIVGTYLLLILWVRNSWRQAEIRAKSAIRVKKC